MRRTQAKLLLATEGFLDVDYRALLAAEATPDLAQTVLFGPEWEAFLASGRGADDPLVAASLGALTADSISESCSRRA